MLTEINAKDTLKKKPDVDYKNNAIPGACNPHLVLRAFQAEDKTATLLPCNVIIIDQGDGLVTILDRFLVCPASLTVSPIPVIHSGKISFYQVKMIYNGYLDKGGHEIDFTTHSLRSGLYHLKVVSNNHLQIKKVIIQKSQ